MTVYVDDMKAEFIAKHVAGRRYVMSHMIADTEPELHAMAARIGVQRRWFQGDHYDITQSKRVLAVKYGAREITLRHCGLMVSNRKAGLGLGDPETADAVWKKRLDARAA